VFCFHAPVDRADLGDHKRRILRFDAEYDADFELHRETVFRNHLEGVESVGDLLGDPFDRLVGRPRTLSAIARRISSVGSLPTFETITATSPAFSGIALKSSGLM
jgi:hypothetical protein